MLKRCIRFWNTLSIRYKAFVLCTILILPALSLISFVMGEFYVYRAQTDTIMRDYARCITYAQSFQNERALFDQFVYPAPSEKTFAEFETACADTIESWQALNEDGRYDSEEISLLRQSITQAMTHYRLEQELFILDLRASGFDAERFADLQTQGGYISAYTDELLELLLVEGRAGYLSVIDHLTTYNMLLFGAIAFTMLALMIGAALMVGNISRPILRLGETAGRIENGVYDGPVAGVERNDEIGQLARAFSSMQSQIRKTIHALEAEARLEKELRLHEAEEARLEQAVEQSRFAQLQSQINPHFLFNTLQTISTMAELEQAAVTEDMIVRLAKFFRYTLETDEALVTLARELDLLRDYISLQEMRFAERLTIEMDCDPSCDGAMVSKFILQPLVENAIVHGMRQRASGGRIRVTTRRRDSCVIITISDNGCGFDRRKPRPSREGRQSIGMQNIAERLAMQGGSLRVFSLPGWGTAARIRIEDRRENGSC